MYAIYAKTIINTTKIMYVYIQISTYGEHFIDFLQLEIMYNTCIATGLIGIRVDTPL